MPVLAQMLMSVAAQEPVQQGGGPNGTGHQSVQGAQRPHRVMPSRVAQFVHLPAPAPAVASLHTINSDNAVRQLRAPAAVAPMDVTATNSMAPSPRALLLCLAPSIANDVQQPSRVAASRATVQPSLVAVGVERSHSHSALSTGRMEGSSLQQPGAQQGAPHPADSRADGQGSAQQRPAGSTQPRSHQQQQQPVASSRQCSAQLGSVQAVDSAQPRGEQPSSSAQLSVQLWGGEQPAGSEQHSFSTWRQEEQMRREGGAEEEDGAASPGVSQPRRYVNPCFGHQSGGYQSAAPGLLRSVADLLNKLADGNVGTGQAAPVDAQPTASQQSASTCAQQAHWAGGSFERLLGLELEVVRLQQALQILQLEFDSRNAQVHSLQARLADAHREAKAAEEKASLVAEAAEEHQAQCRQLETSKAAVEQQLRACHGRERELQLEKELAQQGLAAQQRQAAEWRERAVRLQQENQDLRQQISAACAGLSALGVPLAKVFPKAAVAQAQLPSPPNSPAVLPSASAGSAGIARSPASTGSRRRSSSKRPPSVPRLQLEALAAQPGQEQQQQQQEQQQELGIAASSVQPTAPEHDVSRLDELVQQAREPAAAAKQQEADVGRASSDEQQHLPLIDLGSPTVLRPVQPSQRAPAAEPEPVGGQCTDVNVASADAGAAALHTLQLECPSVAGSHVEATADYEVQRAEKQRAPTRKASSKARELAPAGALDEVRPALDPHGAVWHSARYSVDGAAWRSARHLVEGTAWRSARHSVDSAAGLQAAAKSRHSSLAPRPAAKHSARQEQLVGGSGVQAEAWRASARSERGGAGGQTYRQPSYRQQHQLQQQQQTQTQRRRLATAAAPLEVGLQPRPRPKLAAAAAKLQRQLYGQVPEFVELREAYHAVMSKEDESSATDRWARSMLSSRSAVESNPAKVEPMMQGLIQLFEESDVPMPLKHTGPCQYTLGSAKLVVRLVNGRLMARSSSSNVDVFAWLGKQPVLQRLQQMQH